MQAKVDYTVYAPMRTLGLPRTDFARNGCGSGRGDVLTVSYGSQASLADQSITLQESPGTNGCVDGPDGMGPGSADRPTPTFVEVYSHWTSLAQIMAFVRGLVPAT